MPYNKLKDFLWSFKVLTLYIKKKNSAEEQVIQLLRFGGKNFGKIKPNEGKGEKSAMSITREGD